jgi:hypothetical protein
VGSSWAIPLLSAAISSVNLASPVERELAASQRARGADRARFAQVDPRRTQIRTRNGPGTLAFGMTQLERSFGMRVTTGRPGGHDDHHDPLSLTTLSSRHPRRPYASQ